MTEGGLTELAKTKALQAVWGQTTVPLSSGQGTLEKSPPLIEPQIAHRDQLVEEIKVKAQCPTHTTQ